MKRPRVENIYLSEVCNKFLKGQYNRLVSLYENTKINDIRFIYMDSIDANLQNLKQKYNMKTFAGEGDEISWITNLMF